MNMPISSRFEDGELIQVCPPQYNKYYDFQERNEQTHKEIQYRKQVEDGNGAGSGAGAMIGSPSMPNSSCAIDDRQKNFQIQIVSQRNLFKVEEQAQRKFNHENIMQQLLPHVENVEKQILSKKLVNNTYNSERFENAQNISSKDLVENIMEGIFQDPRKPYTCQIPGGNGLNTHKYSQNLNKDQNRNTFKQSNSVQDILTRSSSPMVNTLDQPGMQQYDENYLLNVRQKDHLNNNNPQQHHHHSYHQQPMLQSTAKISQILRRPEIYTQKNSYFEEVDIPQKNSNSTNSRVTQYQSSAIAKTFKNTDSSFNLSLSHRNQRENNTKRRNYFQMESESTINNGNNSSQGNSFSMNELIYNLKNTQFSTAQQFSSSDHAKLAKDAIIIKSQPIQPHYYPVKVQIYDPESGSNQKSYSNSIQNQTLRQRNQRSPKYANSIYPDKIKHDQEDNVDIKENQKINEEDMKQGIKEQSQSQYQGAFEKFHDAYGNFQRENQIKRKHLDNEVVDQSEPEAQTLPAPSSSLSTANTQNEKSLSFKEIPSTSSSNLQNNLDQGPYQLNSQQIQSSPQIQRKSTKEEINSLIKQKIKKLKLQEESPQNDSKLAIEEYRVKNMKSKNQNSIRQQSQSNDRTGDSLSDSGAKEQNAQRIILNPQRIILDKRPKQALQQQSPIHSQTSIQGPQEKKEIYMNNRVTQYIDFITRVAFSNNMILKLPRSAQNYQYYVGVGNNSALVKNVLQSRWWIQIVETNNYNDVNFIWTQLRLNDFLDNHFQIKDAYQVNIAQPQAAEQEKEEEQNANGMEKGNNNNNLTNAPINREATPQTTTTQPNYLFHFPSRESRIAEEENLNKNLNNQPQSPSGGNSIITLSKILAPNNNTLSAQNQSQLNGQKESQVQKIGTTANNVNNGSVIPSPLNEPTSVVQIPAQASLNYNLGTICNNYNICHLRKIFNNKDLKYLNDYMEKTDKDQNWDMISFFKQKAIDQNMKYLQKNEFIDIFRDRPQIKCHNHLQNNWNLANKKALFYNMKAYYEAIKQNPFDYIPLTFHLQYGTEDREYMQFIQYYNKRAVLVKQNAQKIKDHKYSVRGAEKPSKINNIWIIQPGESTNRGTGITVMSDIEQIRALIQKKEFHPNGQPVTYILQQYIDNPLLYYNRKFDIRCYMLMTSLNGIHKVYWYQEGYIRTSCKQFSVHNLNNQMVHLTNDAIQQYDESYGKFQPEFQRYLDLQFSDQKINFFNQIYPRMKNLARDSIKAIYGQIDPKHKQYTFQIFGLDFMIDDNFKVWLIQVNNNPCLELSAPVLGRVIPAMLDNAFRIALDPIFPPPILQQWPAAKKVMAPDNTFQNNRFELIFDEVTEGEYVKNLFQNENAQEIDDADENQQQLGDNQD